MGKYFGTDGFRGEANVNLTVDHARKVGRFLGWYYGQLKKQRGDDIPAKVSSVRIHAVQAICLSMRWLPGLQPQVQMRIFCM